MLYFGMLRKYFPVFGMLLLFVSCTKEQQLSLSQKNIVITGPGTTYYSDEDYNDLLELSDTSKIYSIDELKHSMNAIVVIFNKYHDRAGAFPTLYNVVTNVAYNTLIHSTSSYATQGRAFMNEFAKHYIRNLHSYLLGKPVEPAWLNYYNRVAANRNSLLHLALSGINAHITYDIPFVLLNIQAEDAFFPDFKEYTDFIAATYPEAAAELETRYGIKNANHVFKMFALGDILDGFEGNGFTTHLVIDVLRTESWNRGMDLVHQRRTETQMHTYCFQSFNEREELIQSMDDQRLLY
jgi:hypothetical protein